ncbi:uncharacterized protein LOC124817085 [Hydra vulgaris]|uniref:uncharacterized protein LOC124817085 n=1 Tax=Hydra vulgaris TaxID=6087 RepID=UPI0032EA37EB
MTKLTDQQKNCIALMINKAFEELKDDFQVKLNQQTKLFEVKLKEKDAEIAELSEKVKRLEENNANLPPSSSPTVCYSQIAKQLAKPGSELSNKLSELSTPALAYEIDVIAIAETWFKLDLIKIIDGYELYQADRDRIGEGVPIYVNKRLTNIEIVNVHLNNKEIEQVWCSINCNNFHLTVGCVYRPPNSTAGYSKLILDSIRTALKLKSGKKYTDLIVVRDFNFPNIDWTDDGPIIYSNANSIEHEFIKVLNDCSLYQIVNFSTFKQNDSVSAVNTSDLVLVCNPNCIDFFQCGPQLSHYEKGRYHYSITWQYFTSLSNNTVLTKDKFCFKKGNFFQINKYLKQVNWVEHFYNKSACECYELFLHTYNESCRLFIPTLNNKKKNSQPWLDAKIKKAIKIKHSMFYSNLHRQSQESRKAFNKMCANVKKQIKRSTREYEMDLVKRAKLAPKLLFSYANRKQNIKTQIRAIKNKKDQVTTEISYISDILNRQFQSVFVNDNDQPIPKFLQRCENQCDCSKLSNMITYEKVLKMLEGMNESKHAAEGFVDPAVHIFKLSFDTGCVPYHWSVANVSLIYKGGSKLEPENYRPEQTGFVPNKSCTTNLIETIDTITFETAKGKPLCVIYLDFAKAFDKVEHKRLLTKIKAYGITGKIYNWIESFLANRNQRVAISNTVSEWVSVTSGVPQGSILGPMLFLLFINDLPEVVLNTFKMYADDSKIIAIEDSIDNQAEMQTDLDNIVKWCNNWGMELNCKKCKVMRFGNQKVFRGIDKTYTMNINGMIYDHSNSVLERDLGVFVQPDMRWKHQTQVCVNKASKILGLIINAFESRDYYMWKILYTNYVRPHLEFAAPAWSPPNVAEISMLERVQRRATKIPYSY